MLQTPIAALVMHNDLMAFVWALTQSFVPYQVQQDSTGVCSRCGEALSFSEGTPEKGSPGKEAASRAPDGAADAAGAPGEGGAAVVSGGSPPAAANGGPIVLADGGLGGRGEDPATQDGGPLQALRGAHAAELVSVQNAFTARMQALQEDLQVSRHCFLMLSGNFDDTED